MSYIVLEGVSLYVFLTSLLLLVVIAVLSLGIAVLTDRKNCALNDLFMKEHKKVKMLVKENFILRLKYGEINVDEE